MSPRSPRLGYALVVLGAVLFVVNAGVSRVLLRAGLTPTELTSLRVTGTVVCLGVVMALVRPATLRPPRGRTLLLMIALGLSGVALVQWAYFVAIDRLAVGMALLLEYTAPILVALWARFVQKEQVRPRLWYALALSIVGLAMIAQVWHGFTLDPVGVAAGFGAAVAFAAYYLLSEHGVSRLDPLTVFFWSFAVAAVALNLVSPVTSLDWGAAGTSVPLLGALDEWSAPVWALLLWVVVPGTLMPFGCTIYALSHLPVTTVTTVAFLEPVGATVLGWVWFGESLNGVQCIGAALVVVGILLAASARTAHPTFEPTPVVT